MGIRGECWMKGRRGVGKYALEHAECRGLRVGTLRLVGHSCPPILRSCLMHTDIICYFLVLIFNAALEKW